MSTNMSHRIKKLNCIRGNNFRKKEGVNLVDEFPVREGRCERCNDGYNLQR